MSTNAQAATAPLFEIFRRGISTDAIKRFRGINTYSTLAQLGPDWAQDLINVVVSGSGGLSKMRLPVRLSPQVGGLANGPYSFFDFQQANGTRQVLAVFGASLYYFTADLTVGTLIETNPLNFGQWSFSEANNILFGANGLRLQKWTGANWWLWGIVAPVNAPVLQPVSAGALSPTVGYYYSYAWMNSVTGHVSNISPISDLTGAETNKQFNPLGAASADPQVDTICWFRSLDGSGDQYLLAQVNIATGAISGNPNAVVTPSNGNLGIIDNTPDGSLNQQIVGPTINNPPIQGFYTTYGQSRVFIGNLVGAPQDVIYSGYEQIFYGRPEESFPPNNRLRLSIGAEAVAGIGVLQAGVVTFSNTGRMYMLRGQVEDISVNLPVNFSAYLQELNWTLGCLSHPTIQATPYGLIWLAGDKTVQMFNGQAQPIDISPAVYPLLRTITPGTEQQCVAGYFNWLERDWYALLCATGGSLGINKLVMFAFNNSPGTNDLESIEVFLSDIPATIGSVSWIGVITTSAKQRKLCIGSGGYIYELPVSSDTVGGITRDYDLVPATAGHLNAFWRSGYFGNDTPFRSKNFRWARLITDQAPPAWKLAAYLVDDEERTFVNPEILGPTPLTLSRIGINRRAKRAAIEIDFPEEDVSSNVLELQLAHIDTADR